MIKYCPSDALGKKSSVHLHKIREIICVVIFASFLIGANDYAWAAEGSSFRKMDDGILVQIDQDQAQAEIAVATPTAFRLSVSYQGEPDPSPSIFLAQPPGQISVPWHLARSGDFVGVETAAGELLVNPISAQWTLRDSSGRPIIPPSEIGRLSQETNSSQSHVVITIGWDKKAHPAFYGSGNGMGLKIGSVLPTVIGVESLQLTNALAHVGNGVTVIPYHWSTSGYAALAVTSDDNKPASWNVQADQASVAWDFPGTTADLYLMPATTLREAAKDYAQLTGYPPVPPRWTFGFMQSRWGWTNRTYIEDAMKQFINRQLPVDVFIYDVEWYTPTIDYSLPADGASDFKDFSWNSALFPDPAAQISAYKAQGLYAVAIRKPRLGNSELLHMMREKHWDLPNWQKNIPVMGSLASHLLDYEQPAVRDWYSLQLGPLLGEGIDGWWNDEGEGSYTTFQYWIMAEQEAQAKFKSGTRLWTLNRAFSPGLQRLGAAVWTGDIEAKWSQLARTSTDLLNWSLAGMPYSTCDIGGFRGNTTPELFTRWMEAGVFYPIMRAHSSVDDEVPHFPWMFGQDAEDAIRKALDLRYRLIPYYYSLAYEAHTNGLPLMRPLVMEFPRDPAVANMSDQWLMGGGLLAAPILSEGNQRSVYLPAGNWYVFDTNTCLNGSHTIVATARLDQIPVYVREGTILPLGPVIQHTDQLPGGPLELQVYPGKNATFTLVEDNGSTTAYTNGEIRLTTFTWNDTTHRLGWKVRGPYSGKDLFTNMKIEVFYPEGTQQAKASIVASGSLKLSPKQSSQPTQAVKEGTVKCGWSCGLGREQVAKATQL